MYCMRRATACLVLFAGVLAYGAAYAQKPLDALISSLLALKDIETARTSHSERITGGIMTLSEVGHRPSRSAVVRLADALTNALIGRHLTDRQASQVAAAILDVLRGAGVDSPSFRESIDRAERALVSLGVNATLAS